MQIGLVSITVDDQEKLKDVRTALQNTRRIHDFQADAFVACRPATRCRFVSEMAVASRVYRCQNFLPLPLGGF